MKIVYGLKFIVNPKWGQKKKEKIFIYIGKK